MHSGPQMTRPHAMRVIARFVMASTWLIYQRAIDPITLVRPVPPLHWSRAGDSWVVFGKKSLALYFHSSGDTKNPVTVSSKPHTHTRWSYLTRVLSPSSVKKYRTKCEVKS